MSTAKGRAVHNRCRCCPSEHRRCLADRERSARRTHVVCVTDRADYVIDPGGGGRYKRPTIRQVDGQARRSRRGRNQLWRPVIGLGQARSVQDYGPNRVEIWEHEIDKVSGLVCDDHDILAGPNFAGSIGHLLQIAARYKILNVVFTSRRIRLIAPDCSRALPQGNREVRDGLTNRVAYHPANRRNQRSRWRQYQRVELNTLVVLVREGGAEVYEKPPSADPQGPVAGHRSARRDIAKVDGQVAREKSTAVRRVGGTGNVEVDQ